MDISSHNNTDLVMTLSEVAAYLKVAEKTVHRMIARSEIPCAKVGGQWRFYRPMIDDWLVAKMRGGEFGVWRSGTAGESGTVELAETFVELHVRPGTKEEVLRSLLVPFSKKLPNRDNFLALLLERELMLSTAVGNGVAFPHVRHQRANPRGGPYLVVGICPEGVDFEAPDGMPVYLFALFCAHDEATHLRGMSKLATLLDNPETVNRLVAARDKETVFEALKLEEAQ